MENTDVSKRLLDFIASIGISTSSFAYQCKVSESVLLKLNGKQQNILCKIYKAYPQLSPYWLERGGGSMLKTGKESFAITDEKLIADIREKSEEVRCCKTKTIKVKYEPQMRERLLLYINYINMSVKDFAISCSLTESSIHTIDKKATPTTLNRIYACYPRLNPVWLQTGNGEMERLTDAVESYKLTVLEAEIKKLTEQIQLKDEQITKLLAMVEEKDKIIAKLVEKL